MSWAYKHIPRAPGSFDMVTQVHFLRSLPGSTPNYKYHLARQLWNVRHAFQNMSNNKETMVNDCYRSSDIKAHPADVSFASLHST